MPTTIFSAAGTNNDVGSQGSGVRTGCLLTGNALSQLRFTFQANTTQPFSVDHAACGKWDGGADTNVTTNPTLNQLKFSTNANFSVLAGAQQVSDWLTQTFTANSGDTLVALYDITAGGPFGTAFTNAAGPSTSFEASPTWNQQNSPDPFLQDIVYGIVLIETQATPGGDSFALPGVSMVMRRDWWGEIFGAGRKLFRPRKPRLVLPDEPEFAL